MAREFHKELGYCTNEARWRLIDQQQWTVYHRFSRISEFRIPVRQFSEDGNSCTGSCTYAYGPCATQRLLECPTGKALHGSCLVRSKQWNTGRFEFDCFPAEQTGWVAGDNGTIRRTPNGGKNWVSFTSSGITEPLNGIRFMDANNGWSVGTKGTTLFNLSVYAGALWCLLLRPIQSMRSSGHDMPDGGQYDPFYTRSSLT